MFSKELQINDDILIGVKDKKIVKINIPDGIKRIKCDAFHNCKNLKDIEIPNSVEIIESGAFKMCLNLNYNIFDNVMYLGNKDNPYLVLVKVTNSNIYNCKIHKDTKIIMDYAFNGCLKLENIVIPEGVIRIEQCAFSDCSNLKNIQIPNTIEYIDTEAFSSCEEINYNVHENCKYLGNIKNPYLVFMGFDSSNQYNEETSDKIVYSTDSNAKNNSNLKKIMIHKTVKIILRYKFFNDKYMYDIYYDGKLEDWCKIIINLDAYFMEHFDFWVLNDDNKYEKLSDIVIPKNIKSICNYQFYGWNNLKKIVIHENIESIGESAFYNCWSLKSIIILKSVISIGQYAFGSCTNLTIYCQVPSKPKGWDSHWNSYIKSIYWGINDEKFAEVNGIQYIIDLDNNEATISKYVGDNADLVITDCIEHNDKKYNITSIKSYAFEYCKWLESIEIPNSVKTIGSFAFNGCENLKIIKMPNNLEIIEQSTFAGCLNLKEVSIPDTVITIEKSAFYNCKSLIDLIIPDSVIEIGAECFHECVNLKTVFFGEGLSIINLPLLKNSSKLISVGMSSKNKIYSINNGCLILKKSKKIIAYFDVVNNKEITIPNYINSIGVKSFDNIQHLKIIHVCNRDIKIPSKAISKNSKKIKIIFDEISDNNLSLSTHTHINKYVIENETPYYLSKEDIKKFGDSYVIIRDLNKYKHIIIENRVEDIELSCIVLNDNIREVNELTIGHDIKEVKFYFSETLNTKILEICSPIKDDMYILKIINECFKNLEILYLSYENVTFYDVEENNCVICFPNEAINYVDDDEFYPRFNKLISVNSNIKREDIKCIDDVYYQITKKYVKVLRVSSNLQKVLIPDNINGLPVTIIGPGAFKGFCGKEIILPNTLTEIEEYAFKNIKHVNKILIPFGVIKMGTKVFFESPNIKIYIVGKKIDHLWTKRWNPEKCYVEYIDINNIEKIEDILKKEETLINNNIEKNENYIFEKKYFNYNQYYDNYILYDNQLDLNNLFEVEIPEGYENLQKIIFSKYLEKIKLPKSLKEFVFNYNYYPEYLESIDLNGNSNFMIENKILIDINKKEYICCLDKKSEIIKFPEGCNKINSLCMVNCNAKKIILPNSLKEISIDIFKKTKVEEIFLGKNVMKINGYSGNVKINIDSDNPYFSVHENAIYSKDKTLFIYSPKQDKLLFPNEIIGVEFENILLGKLIPNDGGVLILPRKFKRIDGIPKWILPSTDVFSVQFQSEIDAVLSGSISIIDVIKRININDFFESYKKMFRECEKIYKVNKYKIISINNNEVRVYNINNNDFIKFIMTLEGIKYEYYENNCFHPVKQLTYWHCNEIVASLFSIKNYLIDNN